jgi:hypothetical protein
MLKVNGVAKGQYKQLCQLSWGKCKGNENLLVYKIRRAVDLGTKTHSYNNGCTIVRYYSLNFLVGSNEIMTIWRDDSRHTVQVKADVKAIHKEIILNQIVPKEKLMEIVANNYA